MLQSRILLVLLSGTFLCGCEPKVVVESTETEIISVGDVTVEEASTLVEGETQVIDIRTPEEYSAGHIPGSINIDFKEATFAEQVKELDNSKPYVVHCQSGGRSGAALPTFQALGFSEIYHLKSGMSGWVDAGHPVAK